LFGNVLNFWIVIAIYLILYLQCVYCLILYCICNIFSLHYICKNIKLALIKYGNCDIIVLYSLYLWCYQVLISDGIVLYLWYDQVLYLWYYCFVFVIWLYCICDIIVLYLWYYLLYLGYYFIVVVILLYCICDIIVLYLWYYCIVFVILLFCICGIILL